MTSLFVAVVMWMAPLQKTEKVAFTFNSIEYVHRYSKDDLREYTPKSQSDLKTFKDMVTINDYPSVMSGEDLAQAANSVLGVYKDNKAEILKTDSVPRTEKKEAEHLIVALFTRSEFVEVSFARFLMADGIGHSLVYSHRTYGPRASVAMSEWMAKYRKGYEKALMALAKIPKH